MITTADAYKRRGYASSVMQKLQDLFPGVEIKWGGTTNEGSRLYAMLPKHEVGVHDYKENEKRLDYVKARLGLYERLEEAFRRHPSPTDDQRTRFLDRIDDWNDLSDEAEDIERWLQRHSAKQVLLVVPDWIHRLPVG